MAVGNVAIPNDIHPIEGVSIGIAKAGVRYADRDDVTVFQISGNTAVVTTQNQFAAAPVQVVRQHLQKQTPAFLLVNTGNANAATGQDGIDKALQTCQALLDNAEQCQLISKGVIEQVLPFSTGVIGESLPSDRVIKGIEKALGVLSKDNWLRAASAIMTTDTVAKIASESVCVGEGESQVVYHATGISKGAGMIRPNMATMLGFVATDANIEPKLLQKMLNQLVAKSFNRITVDGDTSTNDCCTLTATGKANASHVIASEQDNHYQAVYQMLEKIFLRLATLIVRDGEGASKFITIKVTGGKTSDDCAKIAYSVDHSPLVKTAFFASDPNWGRILAAVGNAGVDIEQSSISVSLDEINICQRGGVADDYTEERGSMVMMRDEITVHIDLGQGQAQDTVYTCDLSHDYVSINADYRS